MNQKQLQEKFDVLSKALLACSRQVDDLQRMHQSSQNVELLEEIINRQTQLIVYYCELVKMQTQLLDAMQEDDDPVVPPVDGVPDIMLIPLDAGPSKN